MHNEDDVPLLCKFVDRPLFSSKFNCGCVHEACFCDNLCTNRFVSSWNLFYIIYLRYPLSFSLFFFFYLLCSSPRINCIMFLFLLSASHHWSILLLFLSSLFTLDLFLSFSCCIRSKKYREFSLTYFRRNADRTLSERNINEMLFKNVRQLLFIIVFIRSLLWYLVV